MPVARAAPVDHAWREHDPLHLAPPAEQQAVPRGAGPWGRADSGPDPAPDGDDRRLRRERRARLRVAAGPDGVLDPDGDDGPRGPVGAAAGDHDVLADAVVPGATVPGAAAPGGAWTTDADPPWWSRLPAVRWRIPVPTALAALLALALVGGAVALRVGPAASGPPVTVPEPLVSAAASAAPAAGSAAGATEGDGSDADDEAAVWVHVVGQVAAPGVVALPAGARVADALAAAGGALPGADVAALNLAAVVPDGAQVRVPAPGEQPAADLGLVTADGGVTGGGTTGAGTAADGTVDVNAATAADLETLPGIGPVLAARIVEWRTEHGQFTSVDALGDVSGIGPALLARLADRVRV